MPSAARERVIRGKRGRQPWGWSRSLEGEVLQLLRNEHLQQFCAGDPAPPRDRSEGVAGVAQRHTRHTEMRPSTGGRKARMANLQRRSTSPEGLALRALS